MQPLSEKNQRERDFHNAWAEATNLGELLVIEAFESPTAVENQYALHVMQPLQGKKLLDLGCGAGETSVYFAIQGAEVHCCDIADKFLAVANKLAHKFNVQINPVACSAGELPYQDSEFDYVFGNGVLHHVDLDGASREVYRVLKPGGKAVFIEPLPYNPIINVYRAMAKGVRTDDEKPLSYSEIRNFSRPFKKVSHKEFWLFTLYLFIDFFLVKRWNPSKVRYWKKVIEEGNNYKQLFLKLKNFDEWIMKYCPFLRALCWNTVIVVEK